MRGAELPAGWGRVPLAEITERDIDQGGPSGTGEFVYIDISSIDRVSKRIVDAKRLPVSEAPTRARQRVQPSDVLVSMTRPNLNSVALVPSDLAGSIASTGFHVLRAKGVDPKWLYYLVQSPAFVTAMSNLVQGVLYPAVRPKDILSFVAPVAPLSEQRRVVKAIEAQLTRLDAARTSLERVRANLKRFRASVLKAACEGRLVPTEAELVRREGRDYEPADVLLQRILRERRARWEAEELERLKAKGKTPTDDRWKQKYKEPEPPDTSELPSLPEGWVAASLEQVTSAVRPICYGILMPKEHVPDGVLYVKVRDIRGDRIDLSSLQRTSPTIAAKYARSALSAGDLLLSIRGTYGRVAEVPETLEGGNITQDTARLALYDELDRRYMAWYLRSPVPQGFFSRVARGVGVKGVNIRDVRATPVLLPPPEEQKRIADEVERRISIVEGLEIEVERSIQRAQRLRQAILRQAFTGRLVPQDPDDEPAGVLLERIRMRRQEQTEIALAGAGRGN